MIGNILNCKNRFEFREWLENNSKFSQECYLELKRGKPQDDGKFYYLDAIEEALCFGWIDSTVRNINGTKYQRFSPRRKNGNWSELNKERLRRLIKLGLMTEEGFKVAPDLDVSKFKMDKKVETALKKAGVREIFISFPPLYQRIRSYNISFYRNLNNDMYQKSLDHLIEETKKGKMYGEWNDYGRLLDND